MWTIVYIATPRSGVVLDRCSARVKAHMCVCVCALDTIVVCLLSLVGTERWRMWRYIAAMCV